MFNLSTSRKVFSKSVVQRFASNYITLGSSKGLKDILATEGSKILYFTATWCPPCKKIGPSFENLSKEFSSTSFVKIDIDDHRELAEEYQISAVPTFKAIDGSTVVSTVSKLFIYNVLCFVI